MRTKRRSKRVGAKVRGGTSGAAPVTGSSSLGQRGEKPFGDTTAKGCYPLGAAMLSEHAWAEISRSLKLSKREVEILKGVFDNATEFAISVDLAMSQHTVHTHLNRLFHKLGVTTRTDLILRVIKELLAVAIWQDDTLPPIC